MAVRHWHPLKIILVWGIDLLVLLALWEAESPRHRAEAILIWLVLSIPVFVITWRWAGARELNSKKSQNALLSEESLCESDPLLYMPPPVVELRAVNSEQIKVLVKHLLENKYARLRIRMKGEPPKYFTDIQIDYEADINTGLTSQKTWSYGRHESSLIQQYEYSDIEAATIVDGDVYSYYTTYDIYGYLLPVLNRGFRIDANAIKTLLRVTVSTLVFSTIVALCICIGLASEQVLVGGLSTVTWAFLASKDGSFFGLFEFIGTVSAIVIFARAYETPSAVGHKTLRYSWAWIRQPENSFAGVLLLFVLIPLLYIYTDPYSLLFKLRGQTP
jgi:hypothetical protein